MGYEGTEGIESIIKALWMFGYMLEGIIEGRGKTRGRITEEMTDGLV